MNGGILQSAAALDLLGRMQETRAQNLANANTVGYRKRISSAEVFAATLRRAAGLTLPGLKQSIDFTPGNFQQTGNSLDLAIDGGAFFALETERGMRFTRNGNFSLDAGGFLVASDGARVAGENGPVQADPARGEVEIDRRGAVLQDGEPIGTLRLVEFRNQQRLAPDESGRFRDPAGADPFDSVDSSVKQGYLEMSNVNGIDEMIQMISGMRAFEAAQKALVGIDKIRAMGVSSNG